MKMMSKMEDNIKDIFSNVNEWLKFAEAKNAALIAFNLGSIFGAATVLTQKDVSIPQPISNYLYSFIILSIVGLFFALFSFLPQTKIELVLSNKIEDLFLFKNSKIEDNLLFYGYISNCDRDLYLSKLCESCNKDVKDCSQLELDYINQILVNSRITVRKYLYFSFALFFTIIALLSPILLPVVFLYYSINCILIKQYEKAFLHLVMFSLSLILAWNLINKYVIL